MKVIVGSQNPVKIAAAEQIFSQYYDELEVVGVSVDSGVHDQPIGDATIAGARNRAKKLHEQEEGDYFVGIEGGVAKHNGRWMIFTAVTIFDKDGNEGFGLGPHFELPPGLSEELEAGVELGDVMDRMLNEKNVKQKGGAIAAFSRDKCTRKDVCAIAVQMAIVPLLNRERYFP